MNNLEYCKETNEIVVTDKILKWRAQKITRELCRKLKLEGDFQVDVILTLRISNKNDCKA